MHRRGRLDSESDDGRRQQTASSGTLEKLLSYANPAVRRVRELANMYSVRLKPVAHSSNRHRFLGIMALAAGVLFLILWLSYFRHTSPEYVPQPGLDKKNQMPINMSRFYGIMMDAGSTGSRIHVYTFNRGKANSINLEGEYFEEVKPGLSAYADDPKKASESLRGMLDQAKQRIPEVYWALTPIALKATAGLRMLPPEKSDALLKEVEDLLRSYPFKCGREAVTIMDGTDEGKFIWITLNFLLGVLNDPSKTFGTLDLGGGSTQITFVPSQTATVTLASPEDILQVPIGDRVTNLYTHSYLGFGLQSARKAVMEKSSTSGPKNIQSWCLPIGYTTDFRLNNDKIPIKGVATSKDRFAECYKVAQKFVLLDIKKPDEIRHKTFYAFSYYYERALEAGLIDAEMGGEAKIQDFYNVAKLACNHPNTEMPFQCIDLTYITALLHDGFGFDWTTTLQLKKKIRGVETAWGLGAMFNLLQDSQS